MSIYNNKIEIAQAYCDKGLRVFPVHTLENGQCSCGKSDCDNVAKHPLTVNGFKAATTNKNKMLEYFSDKYERANVAIATGKESGVFVVDVDSIRSLTELEKKHGAFPQTWETKTGNGRHLFYRFPQTGTVKNSTKKIDKEIDIRGEGGYVILPPSMHKDGKRYEWIRNPDKRLADAPAWLLALVVDDQREAKAANKTFTVEAGANERQRAISYLAKCPPAISGSGGSNDTFAIVCRLIELFPSLSDDDLLDVLGEWNERCEPPWSVKELTHKVTSARAKVADAEFAQTTHADEPSEDEEDEEDDDWDVEIVYPESEDEEADDWPVLHKDAYHGLAGDIVKRIEPETEADPVALLVTLLNAFGCLVGRSPYVAIDGSKHHANTFACIVGQSSRSRKGTSLGHILNVLSDSDVERINGLSTGEGIVNRLRDAEDGITDKRLWVVESEFCQPLKTMKRSENTLSPVIRNLWDRGEVSILTRANPLKANGCHVSILGHITREELTQSLDNVDVYNGFGNRFLWTLSRRSKSLPLGGEGFEINDLKERLSVVTQISKFIGSMEFSRDAKLLYVSRYDSLGEGRRGLWDAVCSRAEPQVVRLSMLYALLDGVATIETCHLKAALALWDYCDDSARIIFGANGGDSLETKVLSVIRERSGIKKSDIRNAVSHKLKADDLNASLSFLESRGKITKKVVTENRRRFERWYPCRGQGATGNRTEGDSDSPNAPAQGATGESNGQRPVASCPDAPATLADLFDWRNMNAAEFVKNDTGLVWVTKEERLTPSLRAALETNQEALASFVTIVKEDSKPLSEDEYLDPFMKELTEL
ncbi:bifunctional DNA primase/polymerase [Bremerella alba]|uniref:DNA primase/polymerase bifunctional N-terminal domain-containing protein n=1 Tax=Bremerella alba TaxID=980252 RepID=A0A7V8V9F8_9BACT|nr:bifunctional DNA primase/polymerase [Bremerella alba]MBA2117331.1 hypothetical protein [Bremerella alba]